MSPVGLLALAVVEQRRAAVDEQITALATLIGHDVWAATWRPRRATHPHRRAPHRRGPVSGSRFDSAGVVKPARTPDTLPRAEVRDRKTQSPSRQENR
ncbi:hypothetical protein SAMN05216188_107154 [Lentzea xinjiangensis]|uniref:Uncharacterized protein n=1 Tax=Lentzea xinjiangensis TaxID=402600 RepID=A0A1H9KX76_9PSEU|nr:hypothetical protein [Lentzea xinjiangensis]SER03609.1 hypothetical protein SAMN05216188_107154 [Lentzea xinjiangensis]